MKIERLLSYPPVLVRLLARHPYSKPLSTPEIMVRSGLSQGNVAFISEQLDWSSVTLPNAIAFCDGCGLGIGDARAWRRVRDYLSRNPTFRYLRASPEWGPYYKPLLQAFANSCLPYPEQISVMDKPVRRLIQRLTATGRTTNVTPNLGQQTNTYATQEN